MLLMKREWLLLGLGCGGRSDVFNNAAAAFGMRGADVVAEGEVAIAEAYEDRSYGSSGPF